MGEVMFKGMFLYYTVISKIYSVWLTVLYTFYFLIYIGYLENWIIAEV